MPFEGLSGGEGHYALVFPNAWSQQRELLLSLNDIIAHTNYTIR